MTYEEACKVVRLSAEEIRELGFEASRALLKERQKLAGWTTEQLCKEAAARMHARIEEELARTHARVEEIGRANAELRRQLELDPPQAV
jgi:hypothetical protein